jgi:hypothetical protein
MKADWRRSSGDELEGGGTATDEGGIDAPVKGGKTPAMLDREGKKIDVGQVRGWWECGKKPGVGKREVIGPELVARCSAYGLQKPASLSWGTGTKRVTGATENADESVFRERAGGPAVHRGTGFKKTERPGTMGVVGVCQSNQHIDIK